MNDDDVYEPLALYRDRFKKEHEENTSTFFESLVRRAGIDEAANRETVATVRSLEKQVSDASASCTRWKFARGLAVTLVAVSAVVTSLFLYQLFSSGTVPQSPGPLSGGVCFAIVIAGVWLLVKKLNPAIHALDGNLAGLKGQHAEKLREAWTQLAPLNRLYDWGMMAKLIEKTVPRLVVDPFFSRARLGELRESFGWRDEFNDDKSVLCAQSGAIGGSPFVIAETLDFAWGEETYHGSLTISWEELETYRDSKGNTQTRWVTRTETLTASVTKPKPQYYRQKFLVFGNEAAPDLHFSRGPSTLSSAGDGLFDKWRMNRAIKKLDKLSRNLDDDSGFTIMANREFDALFQAIDRNHEVQFRLLFTPLAQQQMVTLLKDKSVAYGDDFSFVKAGMVNLVQPAHLAGVDLAAAPELFKNYDLAAARSFFNSFSNDYFKHVFFALAPLLTIPIYQQHRSHADIYKEVYGRKASFWEHEAIANHHGQDAFRHPSSITENILKTRADGAGQIAVTAHGFRGEERVAYVEQLGGDGKWHNVPVPWVEYLPVEHTRSLAIRETDGLAFEDFEREAKSSADWQSFFRENDTDASRVSFYHSIASVIRE